MKNTILIIALILINSCNAQQKIIKSLNDNKLTEKIINQFSNKANVKIDNSIFALYFQENPHMTEVHNDNVTNYTHDGITITIYRFGSVNQINEFSKDYEVYKKSNKIFYIFNKNSNHKTLNSFKINKQSYFDMTVINDGYDPKSWTITFNRDGDLEKCSPYDCN